MSILDLCKDYFGTSDLYVLLGIHRTASCDEIKKAYKKLSLKVHPDRVPEKEKLDATEKFKILGKVHSVLNDKDKRAIYDTTGILDEADNLDLQVRDWYTYWKLLFKPVSPGDIAEYEKKYKDSEEEAEDLVKAYNNGKGNMDYILNHVPYSTPGEEPRLRGILQSLIDKGELEAFHSFTNESPRKVEARKRKYEVEEKKAKKLQKEKENKKKMGNSEEEVDDVLSALILRKKERESQADAFFQHLQDKYSTPKKGRTKKAK